VSERSWKKLALSSLPDGIAVACQLTARGTLDTTLRSISAQVHNRTFIQPVMNN
jgi:hypothetical protein